MDKKEYKIEDERLNDLFNQSIYFVESTDFEELCIYQKFSEKYGEENYNIIDGVHKYIGSVNGNSFMPIYVRFTFRKVFDSVICFYEATSRFVDHTMVETYIKNNNKEAKLTDAMNCHVALHKAIELHKTKNELEN